MILSDPGFSGTKSAEILLESLMVLCLSAFIGGTLHKGGLAYPVGLGAAGINLLRLWFAPQLHDLFQKLWRWRWLIALGIFIVMVALQLHVSNSGSFARVLTPGPGVEKSVLFGFPRVFRTDEYAVQLPYYFSQAYNNYDQISYQMSIAGQDMIVGYNSPVLSPTLIGKPFVWGYILLGNAYGISWYFSAKLILMFMTALEMFMILIRRPMLSVFGAFILTWAPAMQWWISPHFYDVIFWACALFVIGYWFFASSGWKRWGFTLLAVCALTGFVLALFPSLQVPCGFLMLALLAACLWRDHRSIPWSWSILLNVFVVIAGTGLVLIPALLQMKEALELLSNTEYPGSRISVGGYGKFWSLFINISSIFQPFADPLLLNNSEIASFTHFAPAFLLFYPYLWYWLKKAGSSQRWVGDVLVLFLVLEIVFLLVPFPEWLVKVTLLSYANRMQIVYGLTAGIFSVWCFAMIQQVEMPHKALAGGIVCLVYGILSWMVVPPMILPGFLQLVHWREVFYILCIGMTLGLWLVFTRFRQLFYCLLICWTAMSGLLVNPLMQGIASVTDYPFMEAARREIEKNPDELWLTTGYDQIQGLLLANGARVYNGVNFYPDFQKWKLLDPDLKSYKVVNRYSHILVTLTGNVKSRIVQRDSPDLIEVQITPNDLKKLGIRYFTGDEEQRKILDLFEVPYEIIFADAESGDLILDLQPEKRHKSFKNFEEENGNSKSSSLSGSKSVESDQKEESSFDWSLPAFSFQTEND